VSTAHGRVHPDPAKALSDGAGLTFPMSKRMMRDFRRIAEVMGRPSLRRRCDVIHRRAPGRRAGSVPTVEPRWIRGGHLGLELSVTEGRSRALQKVIADRLDSVTV